MYVKEVVAFEMIDTDLDSAQYPVITANEVPRDQRLPISRSRGSQESPSGGDVKKSRTHRKGRASGSENRRNHNSSASKSGQSRKGLGTPRPLQRNASSTSSHQSHRSQLVDLVVEDVEAEEEDRAQTQAERGSAWAEGDPRHFA